MAVRNRDVIAAAVVKRRPYGKIVAAYMLAEPDKAIDAARKAGGGLSVREAERQVGLGLADFLVAYNQASNAG